MSRTAPAWVVPVMRAGYGARGLTYLIVGGLALAAAIWGGQAQGTQDALAGLRSEPFGVFLLWAIAIGLVAYAAWRLIDAALDLEDEGTDGTGIIARLGQATTGLIHGAIGVSVASLAMGGGSGSGGGAEDWTARLMSMPYGPTLVAFAGLITIGAGVYYAQKGLRAMYKEDIRSTETTRKLEPILMTGLVAQGIVVGIIGGFLLYAGLTTDPGQAGGIGQALSSVRDLPFGRWLFGFLALGLVAFAIENVVEAIYRVIPRRAGPDVRTLASNAKAKVKAATA